VVVAFSAAQIRGVLLPIAAKNIHENYLVGLFLVDIPGLQVEFGQLLLGLLKLIRAKRYALVASLCCIVAECVEGGRAVALTEPPLTNPVLSLAVPSHAPVPPLLAN
jgi:hypothetical protein